ncbi:MAG: hypothetical protein K8M05_24735, partial [Deltaproteobacteria bacterium]|nr:hypothetical protein [Kofleriaceae bacterium]
RFAGGTRALRWHFAGTLGPAAARQPQCDTFTGMPDATTYGLAEMLAVARRAGAAVDLVTPLSDGTPEEAAAMLAYVAGDAAMTAALGTDRAGTDWETAGRWAARRDGAAVPVALVEIGNEPYLSLAVGPSSSCGRAGRFRQDERWEGDRRIPLTAAEYAAEVRRTATALRAVDPSVTIGAAAMTSFAGDEDVATVVAEHDAATGDAWNPRLVADAADSFDAFVLHPYDFAGSDDRVRLAERARAEGRRLRELAPDKRIAVTELGTLFDADSMLGALVTADFTRVALEEDWLVRMRHILIEDDPTGPFATSAAVLGPDHRHTPGWEASRLLVSGVLATRVPTTLATTAPTDDIVVLATRSTDATELAALVIDRRTGADAVPLPAALALPAGCWTGTVTTIDAPFLTSLDVTVTEAPIEEAAGAVDLTIAPTSIVLARVASCPHG